MSFRKHQILWGILTGLCSIQASADFYEYPYLYRAPRVMGMAGADVAIGGDLTSVFSNPAGLASLPDGSHVLPFNLSGGISARTLQFLVDLDNAMSQSDTDTQRQQLLDVFDEYQGRNIHGQASFVSSFGWRGLHQGLELATSLTLVDSERLDSSPHKGFGGYGIASVHARKLSGIVFAGAWTNAEWSLGLAAKAFVQKRLEEDYSARDLVEIARNNESFTDDYKRGSAASLDVGLQYDFIWSDVADCRIGTVIQNIGDLDFGEAGTFTETTNLGISLTPKAPKYSDLTFSTEYIDLFHNFQGDDDPIKRSRFGLRWQFHENEHARLSATLGIYQAAPSFGIELQSRYIETSIATYAEERGVYSGQNRERRYIAGVTFIL